MDADKPSLRTKNSRSQKFQIFVLPTKNDEVFSSYEDKNIQTTIMNADLLAREEALRYVVAVAYTP